MRTVHRAAALVAALLVATPAAAQQHGGHGDMAMPTSGLRAELIQDLEASEAKVVALAEAMSGHWDWRPGEGVRSAGEVFGHIAAANFMLPTFAGIAPPEEFQGADQRATMGNLMALEKIGDTAEMVEHIRHSFTHARHAIARIDDARMDEAISYFGMDGTIRSLVTLLAAHAHEHLGQSIAYARTNGVVPPWSGAGQ